ncbi:tRNA pseudouridine(13) synthase TruD [Psychrobacter sp. UBA3962]|uniref:tRNA pseudouridine(13) synthase TruD n=1 Tax=Psychrobacter sp. UBA3962 TaxID=1947352 RepID=UPI0025FEFB0F|nr:tRNA pseudouridine(13) synthase TruD [Psychrobacter sp. UBA3962]
MTSATAQTPISPEQITQLTDSRQWAQPTPAPICSARFKQAAADFQVDELLEVELSGAGEHLWLLIKKSGMNTSFVAVQLAKWAKIPSRDVGYSGLKDRQAVTTQWFSLRIPKGELPESRFDDFITANLNSESESVQVLKKAWHSKKLNRGTHKANKFVIRLTDIELNPKVAATTAKADEILTVISKAGVPNYFGEQRFGRQGNNIASVLEWFEQGTINGRKPHPKKSRDLQSLLLSSARSAIFNQIVSTRVEQNCWDKALEGDVFNLNGSGSVFSVEQIDQEIQQRLASGDIHPTAPLWGIKNDKVGGAAKALEQQVVAQNTILQRLAQGLEKKELKTMRRATRLPVNDLSWTWPDEQSLILQFTLPTGTFATSVLASLVTDLTQ